MIELNVLNMKEFLETVNACSGEVNLIHPNGRRVNINKQYGRQERLLKQYKENKKSLRLSLDIPAPKDYMKIVFYYIGDC